MSKHRRVREDVAPDCMCALFVVVGFGVYPAFLRVELVWVEGDPHGVLALLNDWAVGFPVGVNV